MANAGLGTTVMGQAPQRAIPRAAEIKAFLYGNAIMGETRRFRQLDRYEAFYVGTQYAHQTIDWWGMPADMLETVSPEVQVPMGFTQPAIALSVRMKRPTAPYNLAKAVVDRFTGLLFSEQRRPDVMVEGDPDTEDFMLAAMEQMRFWAKWREARTMGGALGSVLMTAHLRAGRFSIEVHNPKHVQIVWKERRTLQPAAVLKAYRYPVEMDDRDPKTGEIRGTKIVMFLYRRIITEEDDTVYVPVNLEDPEASLEWVIESEVQHGLGFFPGVWVQNRSVLDQEDGDPDCHGAWQGFDTYDRILSQMNKAVLLNLDPTVVLGVDPKIIDSQGGVRKGSDNALMVGQGGSATYMEITGSGVETGMKLLTTIKQNILDVVRCVLVDPQTLSGAAQSAKAIEYIYAPMLEAADDLRAQYGDLGVLPVLQIVEKIARKYVGAKLRTVDDREAESYIELPPGKNGAPRTLGPGGYLRIKWGPYFSPTEQDKKQTIDNIVSAKAGGLIDEETAVKQGAPVFDIRDPGAVLNKVREERSAEMDRAMASVDAGVPAADGGGEAPAPGAGQGAKP